jgi:hypothetical protein
MAGFALLPGLHFWRNKPTQPGIMLISFPDHSFNIQIALAPISRTLNLFRIQIIAHTHKTPLIAF